ncbi:hypothetical protein SISNIDRAFT_460419 [Sistotremastrum niveocremeum HHB9708]|uniref:Uncharacterized protein n=1 Tax=Sistotremastrum niveocremeum HHB9708 TaxID=1314777 RepID=A0A164NR51_9AGAM|nr:hypothetical protein SISNIDRAFT_460419 [Sistotremastrum niveocremeum HHB9708]
MFYSQNQYAMSYRTVEGYPPHEVAQVGWQRPLWPDYPSPESNATQNGPIDAYPPTAVVTRPIYTIPHEVQEPFPKYWNGLDGSHGYIPTTVAGVPDVCTHETRNTTVSASRAADQVSQSLSKRKRKSDFVASNGVSKEKSRRRGRPPKSDRNSARPNRPQSPRHDVPPSQKPDGDCRLNNDEGGDLNKIPYERPPIKKRNTGRASNHLDPLGYNYPVGPVLPCTKPLYVVWFDGLPVEPVLLVGPFERLEIMIRSGFEQTCHSIPMSTILDGVGTCDERATDIIKIYFQSPHLDVLQGFDVLLSEATVQASLAFFGLSRRSSFDFVQPTVSQIAASMIALDIVDLVQPKGAYSGFFLRHAMRCLEYVALVESQQSDWEFPYALLLLGLRTFYCPEDRTKFHAILHLIPELLRRQSYSNTAHLPSKTISQFLYDTFSIVCAMYRTVHPSHQSLNTQFLKQRLNEITEIASPPYLSTMTRKELLFKARVTEAYWHLTMWQIPESYYKNSDIRDFEEDMKYIKEQLNAHDVHLDPVCLHS